MQLLTIVAIIIFVGYSLAVRSTSSRVESPDSSPQVMSETDVSVSPTPTLSPAPVVTTTPKPKLSDSSKSKIDINVDTKLEGTTTTTEKLIYPGAVHVSGNTYETTTDGDTVYNWYKGELEKRSFQIRNNVRTKANEKFKAVLQGVSDSSSIKVTIDQENSGAKALITLE